MYNKRIKMFIKIICIVLFFTSCYLINIKSTKESKEITSDNNYNTEKNISTNRELNTKKNLQNYLD